nr:MAG TPA: hypothetical protein [Caudoviricetes sp.]
MASSKCRAMSSWCTLATPRTGACTACTSMQPVSGQGWLSAASGTSRTAKTRHPRWWWTAMWPCPPA